MTDHTAIGRAVANTRNFKDEVHETITTGHQPKSAEGILLRALKMSEFDIHLANASHNTDPFADISRFYQAKDAAITALLVVHAE